MINAVILCSLVFIKYIIRVGFVRHCMHDDIPANANSFRFALPRISGVSESVSLDLHEVSVDFVIGPGTEDEKKVCYLTESRLGEWGINSAPKPSGNGEKQPGPSLPPR